MADVRTIVSSTPIKQKCMDCDTEYMASKVVYSDGHTNITPKRCEACQTRHLCNLRVDKHSTACKHIANLKLRLTKVQRQAVIDQMTNDLNTVYEVFQGTTVARSGFDLAKVAEDV